MRLFFILLSGSILPATAQVRINEIVTDASDRLLQRNEGVAPQVGNLRPWQHPGYEDSRWRVGPAPFGFGSFIGVTVNTNVALDIQNRVPSLYLRNCFNATAGQAASDSALELQVRYNDGFVAYLNGVEIARRNMGNPGMFAFHDQTAFNVKDGGGLETINLGPANGRLIPGENTICIQVHNQAIAGDQAANLLIQPSLRIAGESILVPETADWRYLPGLAEPSGGILDYGVIQDYLINSSAVAWAARAFNDSSWAVGTGPVGVEGASPPDYILGTNLHAQTYNQTPSIYQRNVFTASTQDVDSDLPLGITIDYDDGIIIYLNGREIVRRNLGTAGVPTPHDTLANANHDATGDSGTTQDASEFINLDSARSLLVAGDNVLAVQLHRASLTSEDSIARVTLQTSGPNARVLTQPSDPVRYFIGTGEPVVMGQEQEDTGAGEEPPDAENDWIELFNAAPVQQDLTGWSLTDDVASPRKWVFPPGTRIPAEGYLVVLATGLNLGPADGATYLHTNFKLSSSGEYVGLVRPDNSIADQIAPAYPPQNPMHSYGRDSTGVFGFLSEATPASLNSSDRLMDAIQPPAFSVPGGFHSSLNLALSCPTPGAEIRYTTNGSEPTANSSLYTSQISITSTRIIRARAFKPACVPSPVITHTYLLNQSSAKRSLPAIILGGDPKFTFYGPNNASSSTSEGVMAIKGGSYIGEIWDSGGDTSAFHFPSLRGRATEKPATLEYLPLAGPALRTDFGLRIAGSTFARSRYKLTTTSSSRFTATSPSEKPSFNFFFRSEFGDRPIDYPFFDENPVSRFTDIRARAGKNDISNPFITDELLRRVFVNMGQIGSTGTFNTLWINGTFKGYYNLTERLREGFMQEHHNSGHSWDVQQVNEFADGDPIHWNRMIAYLRSANLADTAGWNGVHQYLDVDNFIDYLLVNTYAGMWDWPNNNWVAARERSASGLWRFYMWDAEGAFGLGSGRNTSYNSFTSDLLIPDALTTTKRYIPAIYTLLSESPEFKLRFADRAQKHFLNQGALMQSNITPVFTKLRDLINPIMQETIGTTVNESFHNNWIVSGTRRTNYFNQLAGRGHWPSVAAPVMQQHGGTISAGFGLVLTNPNGDGTILYRTDGGDPRAPGGIVNGITYSGPITLNTSTTIRARVRSSAGVWSPEVVALFQIPSPRPTFLPTVSADWNLSSNWSTHPAPHPNAAGVTVNVPAAPLDRNVNLRSPVTIGGIEFPMQNSAIRNRVRDRDIGNTLTFDSTSTPVIEVSGTGTGYVEFENLAGTVLARTTELRVLHGAGNPDYGALRLRANWTGPGGLTKTGIGIASLTGEGKSYSGPTLVSEGVLSATQPAAPSASSSVSVLPGGQLRLTSGSDPGLPRVHVFGGPVSLYGEGRGPQIPDDAGQGKSGALRYDPGSGTNHAIITTPVVLAGPATIHVDGSSNTLEVAGTFGGPHALIKSGGGTLTLSGDLSSQEQPIEVNNGTLAISGNLTPAITLASTATLSGHGSTGPVSGTGAVLLDRTLMGTPSANVARHAMVFATPGMPNFTTPAAAGNGVLVMNSPPSAGIALDIYLDVPLALPGTVFQGAWITPYAASLPDSLANSNIRVFIADQLGSQIFNGKTWSSLVGWDITTTTASTPSGYGFTNARVLELKIGDTTPSDYAQWRALHFTNPADMADPEVSGPAADPLRTGIANLLAYAMGLPPGGTAISWPQLTGSPEALAIKFPFESRRDDIDCVLESTGDLTDWSNPEILFNSATDFPPPPDVNGIIQIEDESPPTPQRYYRLRITLRTP